MSGLAVSAEQLSDEVLDFFASKLTASEFSNVVGVSARQQVLMNLTVGRETHRAESGDAISDSTSKTSCFTFGGRHDGFKC